MSRPSRTRFRVLPALVIPALLVSGAVPIASAGPGAPQVVQAHGRSRPPLGEWARGQAALAGGPRASATPQLVQAVVDNGSLTAQILSANRIGRVTTTNGLFIHTYDWAGVLADRAFPVLVAF
ncbi:hypothetical protein AB0I60_29630 [Actinosynnema sp. NPDC050436]|uniref:hypothetical protein n=1 Tax=Actinosynnema sp. NPDC050436 TaxID=3155659 RepID=UPI003402B31C